MTKEQKIKLYKDFKDGMTRAHPILNKNVNPINTLTQQDIDEAVGAALGASNIALVGNLGTLVAVVSKMVDIPSHDQMNNPIKKDDFIILKKQDGDKVPGIYIFNTSGAWEYVGV